MTFERAGLVVLILAVLLPTCLAHQGANLGCWLLQTQVTVDGKWSSSEEWTDTSETPMFPLKGNGTAYIKTKHDSTNLYILVDFVSSHYTRSEFTLNALFLTFDGRHDDGALPKKDDFQLNAYASGQTRRGPYIRWGTDKGGWEGISGPSWDPKPESIKIEWSWNSTFDPYIASDHLVWELSIPLTFFNSSTVGFQVHIYEGEALFDLQDPGQALTWPEGSPISGEELTHKNSDMRQLGDLTLSASPIPEFPPVAVPVILVVSLAFLFYARRRLVFSGKTSGQNSLVLSNKLETNIS